MISYSWLPLEGLEAQSYSVDFQEIDSLHQQWTNFRDHRVESDPNAYRVFLERVYRRWAIETGIIEGIYNIDRGTTNTLVEHGLIPDLIEHGTADRDPYELVKVLKDHQASAEFVTESIRRRTPFTKHFIRELHQILTRHQETYTAVDQFNRIFETQLDKGGFKKLPNNPTRPDEQNHEYCPPEQVDSEVDSLLTLFREYDNLGSRHHKLLIAAWMHHRFTQIHPFQDGNGRVARALLTWYLARERYLPIVISRDDRPQYIESLELADEGDLNPFVNFIVRLERRMILEALGEPAPAARTGMVSQVLDHIAGRVRQRQKDKLAEMRSVNNLASALQETAGTYLESQKIAVETRLYDAGLAVQCTVDSGGPQDNREHWYRLQLVETAKAANHWANLNEDRYFIKLAINPEDQSSAPRLIFVISLHHVGRQLTGIMAATAFAQIVNYQDGNRGDPEEPPDLEFNNCATDAFTFTWQDNADIVASRFQRWIEEPFTVALSYWSSYIS